MIILEKPEAAEVVEVVIFYYFEPGSLANHIIGINQNIYNFSNEPAAGPTAAPK